MTDINIDGIVTWLGNWFQEKLVSGTNLKTVGNESLLGSGNISLPTQTSDLTNDGSDGINPFVSDNDSRLSDARTPTSHTHTLSNITDLTVEQKSITVTSPTSGSNYFSGGTRTITATRWGKIVNVYVNFYNVSAKQSATNVTTTIGTLPDGWKPKFTQLTRCIINNNSNIQYAFAEVNANGNIGIRTATTSSLSSVRLDATFTFITP